MKKLILLICCCCPYFSFGQSYLPNPKVWGLEVIILPRMGAAPFSYSFDGSLPSMSPIKTLSYDERHSVIISSDDGINDTIQIYFPRPANFREGLIEVEGELLMITSGGGVGFLLKENENQLIPFFEDTTVVNQNITLISSDGVVTIYKKTNDIEGINTTTYNEAPCYPNPATDYIMIPADLPLNAYLTIYSADGRMVDNHVIPGGTKEYRLNLAIYTPGVYLYRLNDGKLIPFIKER